MLCVPRLSAELLISKNQCPADFPADLRGLGSLALPSLPLSAVTLRGRKRRISRSTDGHLLFHCYYCIEPYVWFNHAHLRGETWMKLKLSRAGNLTLRFPDRRLHVCIICANSKSKNCHTFIITSPVSTDTCTEQPPQDQSSSDTHFTKVWTKGACYCCMCTPKLNTVSAVLCLVTWKEITTLNSF